MSAAAVAKNVFAERKIGADLRVIKCEGWGRGDTFDRTGLVWVNPSPNLRTVEEATLYPGLGMLDATNISVGRGTAEPFEVFGAGATPASKDKPAEDAWFDGKAVADYLTARQIPGVTQIRSTTKGIDAAASCSERFSSVCSALWRPSLQAGAASARAA